MRYTSRILAAAVVLLWGLEDFVHAQETPAHAMTNITLHNSDGSVTESATIVWRDGIIEEIGTNVTVPFDAFTIDGGDSLHVYPGFIDGLATWGSPSIQSNLPELPNPGDPPYDRAGVQPERVPSELMTEDKSFEEALKSGFTTAALGLEGNMLAGQVEVFSISPEEVQDGLMASSIALQGSFETAPGGWSSGAYPSTLMGVMAKFRQVMYDAEALQDHINYHNGNPEMPAPKRSAVLEAMFPLVNKTMPLYFETDIAVTIELMYHYQDEFGFDIVLVSGEEAYKEADELKRRNIPVLVSFDVDEAPKWYQDQKKAESDTTSAEPEELTEEEQTFRDHQFASWKEHVTNIRALLDAGVQVGYSSAGLSPKDLSKKIEILLEEGELTEQEIIRILTVNTASILGVDASFGEVDEGKNASFTVFDKPVFEKKSKVVTSVSNGEIYEF
jgi:imidazolonepropionase-like amidohydrolase